MALTIPESSPLSRAEMTTNETTHNEIKPSKRERRNWWQTAFLLFLIFWIQAPNAYRGATTEKGLHGYDFRVVHEATQRLQSGQPLYQVQTKENYRHGIYLYSPLVAVALKPLGVYSLNNAIRFWAALNVMLLTGAVVLFAFASRFTPRDVAAAGAALIMAFHFWPTVFNFGLGQFNVFILFLVSLLIFLESRSFAPHNAVEKSSPSIANAAQNRGEIENQISREYSWWSLSRPATRDLWWGVVLAVAVLSKTWMLGLLLYLLLQRRVKAMVYFALFYGGALVVLFFLVGWNEYAGFVRNTLGAVSQPWLVSNSIAGFARLHLAQNQLGVQPFFDNALLFRGFISAAYLTLAFAFWTLWKRGPACCALESRLRLGFIVASLLLMSTLCHIEYFVLALPLLWMLICPAAESREKLPAFVTICAVLIYVGFARPWPHSPNDLMPYSYGWKPLLISMPFFLNAALCVLAFFALARVRLVSESNPNASDMKQM